jgi:predicted nuclease of predicted toxin-antitoxin system
MSQLRFLVDVGVGRKIERWLMENGYDVSSVRDTDPKAKDIDILKKAVSESRIVITMDKDFGELICYSGKAHAGVMILRLSDARADEKIEVLKNILRNYSDQIENSLCVYQDGRLRIKKP